MSRNGSGSWRERRPAASRGGAAGAARPVRPAALAADGPRRLLQPLPGGDPEPLDRWSRSAHFQLPLHLCGVPGVRQGEAREPGVVLAARRAGRGHVRPGDRLRRQLAAVLPAALAGLRHRAASAAAVARPAVSGGRGQSRRRLARGQRLGTVGHRLRHLHLRCGDRRDPHPVGDRDGAAGHPAGTGPDRRGEGAAAVLPGSARPAGAHALRDRRQVGGRAAKLARATSTRRCSRSPTSSPSAARPSPRSGRPSPATARGVWPPNSTGRGPR